MGSNRISIARLMGIVAIAAVNIAAVRAILAYDLELLVGIALTWIALHIGLMRLIRSRGRRRDRAFWAGFLGCGLAAMLTYVWAMIQPTTLAITPAGTVVETPGSPMFPIWHSYLSFVSEQLLRRISSLGNEALPVGLLLIMLFAFIPQWIIAVAGGLVARAMVGRGRTTTGRIPGPIGKDPIQSPSPTGTTPSMYRQFLR
jgi:hypothetical protein